MTDKQTQTVEFQAEVKKMLDIVIHSLYTDAEIFLRELVSNAADALEKARYLDISGQAELGDAPLEIRIGTDKKANTLTIRDNGIGMTRQEVIENLGTIAHSGARAFIEKLGESDSADVNLIGQFGVGFYSAFMVADRVELTTRTAGDGPGVHWSSEGSGSYEIREEGGGDRGTAITLHLKADCKEYAKAERIREVIQRYSSFVSFPILVDGEKVNTIGAIWLKNKKEIKPEEYLEFYKFVADDYQEPLARYHFSVDAPLSINALLYVPKENLEMRGFGQMEPGVRLYSRRVLIQQADEQLLPSWLRFLKGVVDSPEIPLNISRETMQDSLLMKKIGKVITGRFLRFLGDMARRDEKEYLEFYRRFGVFLKEGLASDSGDREKILKLLRFESSREEPGTLIGLETYLERKKEEQKEIYFICGSSRPGVERGPYLEAFRERDLEVLYSYDPLDDYVLTMAGQFQDHPFASAETAQIDLERAAGGLPEEEATGFAGWLQEVLGSRVSEVRVSRRLVDSPALVQNPMGMSSSLERWFSLMEQKQPEMPRILEINPSHPLVIRLSRSRTREPERARAVAGQLFDNAMLSAGLGVDFQELVARVTRLMEESLPAESEEPEEEA